MKKLLLAGTLFLVTIATSFAQSAASKNMHPAVLKTAPAAAGSGAFNELMLGNIRFV